MRRNGVSADVIVVDPPRKGCDEALLETMLKMNPEQDCICELRFCYPGQGLEAAVRGEV